MVQGKAGALFETAVWPYRQAEKRKMSAGPEAVENTAPCRTPERPLRVPDGEAGRVNLRDYGPGS